MPKLKKTIKKWFEVPNDSDQGRVEIKHLTDGETDRLTGETLYMEVGGGDPRVAMNISGAERAAAKAAIMAWENFFDDEGSEMACTPRNIELWLNAGGFLKWIQSCRAELKAEVEKQEKEREKN